MDIQTAVIDDYPHSEGVPEPSDFMKEACGGLTAGQVKMVMHDNAVRFMEQRAP
jgi:hypothetical protein